jgi:signal transduction histidine kinase
VLTLRRDREAWQTAFLRLIGVVAALAGLAVGAITLAAQHRVGWAYVSFGLLAALSLRAPIPLRVRGWMTVIGVAGVSLIGVAFAGFSPNVFLMLAIALTTATVALGQREAWASLAGMLLVLLGIWALYDAGVLVLPEDWSVHFDLREPASGLRLLTTFAALGSVLVLALGRVLSKSEQALIERVRTLETLRENEELLQLAMSATQLGAFEWDVEADRSRAPTQIGPGVLPPTANLGAFLAGVHADDVQHVSQLFRDCVEGRADSFEVTYRRVRPEGTRWIDARARMFTREGRRVVVGTYRDVTERVEADRRARETHERLRTIASQVPGVVYEFKQHPDGRFSLPYASEGLYALFGAKAEQVVDDASAALNSIHPDDLPRVLDSLVTSARDGKQWSLEFRVMTGGQTRWLYGTAVPSHLPDGCIVWHGFTSDVTQRRLMEEEVRASEERYRQLSAELEQRVAERTIDLANANKELEAFSYSVSHDLRAPLRSVDGFSQALLEDLGDKLDATTRSHLDIIRAESQRMGHLIDDLLGLARWSRKVLNRGPVELSALANETIAALRTREPERQVSMIVASPLAAYGDEGLLRIVLNNLIGNAWKFTRRTAEPRIEVGEQRIDGRRTFFVRDNGVGFDMKYASKLFEAFQRMHRAEDFEGSGVGLATVKRIIHRHGGTLWAEAEPDRGATFFFTLSEDHAA